jgi:hypothetical protein
MPFGNVQARFVPSQTLAHVPVPAQGDLPPTGAPAIGVQVPSWPLALHAPHESEHAESQQ